MPTITEQWQDTHTDTKIGAEQLPALTTISFLVCEHGGIIRVWRSGQEVRIWTLEDDGSEVPLFSGVIDTATLVSVGGGSVKKTVLMPSREKT